MPDNVIIPKFNIAFMSPETITDSVFCFYITTVSILSGLQQ